MLNFFKQLLPQNSDSNKTVKIEIYSRPKCHLCDEAKIALKNVKKNIGFELIERDITQHSDLFEKYKEEIPVIFINGKKAFKYRVSEKELTKKIYSRSF